MTNFLSKNKTLFLFVSVILFVVLVSLPTLTTKPRLWVDEAKSIELALNFTRFGVLDIQTAPGEFSGIPHLLQSTGYPVTVPLALIFSIFGFSMTAARLYMLVWMVGALCAIYFFLKRLFDVRTALFSIALVATFASFHDNARTVVGEIPGFLFLLAGLGVLLFVPNRFPVSLKLLGGFFLGLAVMTKPSVYLMALPAIAAALYFRKEGIKHWFWEVFLIGCGSAIPLIIWFFVVIGDPFSVVFWREVILFWQNPFDAPYPTPHVFKNIKMIFTSTTLIYFGGLFFLFLTARKYFWEHAKTKIFYVFLTLYGIFAFLYYLRSPGWLRYIIAAELLILMAAPHALSVIIKRQRLVSVALSGLVIIQIIHFFTAAQIYRSDVAIRTGEYINREFPHRSVGVLNAITLGIFLDPEQKHQVITMSGLPQIGKNPILLKNLPAVIIGDPGTPFLKETLHIVDRQYKFEGLIEDYAVYVRR